MVSIMTIPSPPIRRPALKLVIMNPAVLAMSNTPMRSKDTPKVDIIDGHATPSMPSGMPSKMKIR